MRDNAAVEDLHAILGVPPGASPQELTAAFRALAKRSHPDATGGDAAATAQMAKINAAYETLRRHGASGVRVRRGAGRPRPAAAWLAPEVRLALGVELLDELEMGETVELLTPVATGVSARALMALTDRRVLWLDDDAVLGRVRSLRRRELIAADVSLSWPRRRYATLRLRGRDGRRHRFDGLGPALAAHLARALAPAGAVSEA